MLRPWHTYWCKVKPMLMGGGTEARLRIASHQNAVDAIIYQIKTFTFRLDKHKDVEILYVYTVIRAVCHATTYWELSCTHRGGHLKQALRQSCINRQQKQKSAAATTTTTTRSQWNVTPLQPMTPLMMMMMMMYNGFFHDTHPCRYLF